MDYKTLTCLVLLQWWKKGNLQVVGEPLLWIWQPQFEQDWLAKSIETDGSASIWQVRPEVTTQAEAIGGKYQTFAKGIFRILITGGSFYRLK